jgi:hypothetical protein
MIVVDTFGYIGLIHDASSIISDYHQYLKNLRILDQKINETQSIMDGIKDQLKETTIRITSEKETRRSRYESVITYMDKADECKEKLESMLEKALINPEEIEHPKRYSIENLEKMVGYSLKSRRKELEDLKSQLEVSKRFYDSRGFIYQKMHSDDIKRNNNILTHTESLINITKSYLSLYNNVVGYIDHD